MMCNQIVTVNSEIFAELPQQFREERHSPWSDARRGGRPIHSFLEGPAFDKNGLLYFTDIPFGRIFRADPQGNVELAFEYDGEPNGLKIGSNGRLLVADYRNGIVELDLEKGTANPLVSRMFTEHLKGCNDLFVDKNGVIYFTDQGRTGWHDPTGRVFRLDTDGGLHCLLNRGVNPNGVVLSKEGTHLYVGMTNANAVWRLELMPGGAVTNVGTFIQLSGGIGPDGLALTAEGGLVIAHPGMGAVWVFDPVGRPKYQIETSGSNLLTNIAFNPLRPNELYITDAGNGCILRAELPVLGHIDGNGKVVG